jgi:putative ATPase
MARPRAPSGSPSGPALFAAPADFSAASAAASQGKAGASAPLAERMRPQSLDELVGHPQWLGPEGFVRQALEAGRVPSLILWGPPGTGKTTIARLVARHGRCRFAALSAVLDGVGALRELVAAAEDARRRGHPTVLFVDEIHRWSKGQQDALLPHVESGTVSLIGATTDNPGFALVSALLSRCQVVVLEALTPADLTALLQRAVADPRGYANTGLQVTDSALQRLATLGDGDARRTLTALETAADWVLAAALRDPTVAPLLDDAVLDRLPLQQGPRHDRDGDAHFQVVSALIKSLRGSDPDAALYWLARLLAAGEDPRFLARRLVIFAAEDVGNADPQALVLAMAAAQAHELCGMPESRIPLAQATAYLASAPKSKAAYLGLKAAQKVVMDRGSLPVPLHLRNPSSSVGEALGWGRDYQDPHAAGGWVAEHYLPDALRGTTFYQPTRNGAEARIADRLQTWRQLRQTGQLPADTDKPPK